MADSPHHPHQSLAGPAEFDLSDALRRWREPLSVSPAFSPDDLEELESHLRDSIASLQASGLSAREAFWVASSRVGTPGALDTEFSKVNAERVWLDRALWMVAGSLGIQAVVSLVSWVTSLSVIGIYSITGRRPFLGALELATYVVAAIVAFAAVWQSGRRGRGIAWRMAGWIQAHPVGGAVAVAMFFGVNAISSMLTATIATRVMPWPTYASMLQWRWFTVALPVLFWPAVLAWLLRRRAHTCLQK